MFYTDIIYSRNLNITVQDLYRNWIPESYKDPAQVMKPIWISAVKKFGMAILNCDTFFHLGLIRMSSFFLIQNNQYITIQVGSI